MILICDLRHTVRRVLPTSHCVFKLGSHVAFAQYSGPPFFGTRVQSRAELSFKLTETV